MNRSALWLWTGIAALALTLAGCFGAYQTSPDNALGAGGLVPTQEDKDAGRVAVAPGFDVKQYRVIVIERIPVAASQIEDEGDRRFADKMAHFYQSELVRRLRDTGLFTQVVNGSEARRLSGAGKTLTLRGTITRLGRGSQAARYFVGFGAGSTRAQAELSFVDDSGRVVLVTADRRMGSAGWFGGDDEDFLKESFDDMARDLAKFLVRLSNGDAPR